MNKQKAAVQSRACWLGYIGLLPFIMLVGLLATTQANSQLILTGIQGYAAVILTFIGAIHWGRAMDNGNAHLITFSVWPSIFAWCVLLLPSNYGLPLLILAFIVLFLFDYGLYSQHVWFRRLRMHLTFAVCLLLSFSWIITLESFY